MRIGLISDTHDNERRVGLALDRLRGESIGTVLHAGDVSSSQTLRLLAGFDVWVARGNVDRDPLLFRVSRELFGPGRYRSSHTLNLDGVTLGLVHIGDSDTARAWLASGACDYVVHGHTHRPRDERVGRTRVINPGALHHPRGGVAPSFGILNLATGDFTLIELA